MNYFNFIDVVNNGLFYILKESYSSLLISVNRKRERERVASNG